MSNSTITAEPGGHVVRIPAAVNVAVFDSGLEPTAWVVCGTNILLRAAEDQYMEVYNARTGRWEALSSGHPWLDVSDPGDVKERTFP